MLQLYKYNTVKTLQIYPCFRYLLHNHRDVTISDLQGGLSYLEEECGQHTSSDIEFVKTHIDVLLACHDTLQKVGIVFFVKNMSSCSR